MWICTHKCWYRLAQCHTKVLLDLFLAKVSILYPLKTPENLWSSGVFGEYKMGILAGNGLILLNIFIALIFCYFL